MDQHEYTAHLLRELRGHSGLTQMEFSARTGLDQGYISKCERGKHSMSLDRFVHCCECVGVKPAKVFDL
jgi:transcriptional regulator with XRE-family HTH domain